MPITRNALLRYHCLDKCFRNPGRKYFIEDLLVECNNALAELNPHSEGIKKRQLYEDIRFMESSHGWEIPLERYREGRRTYLRYSDLSFSISNEPINQMEAEQLKSAMLVLQRFKGMPQFNWINEILPKLDQTFGLSTEHQEIISFDNNEYLTGLEFIDPIFNAILYKKVLSINYQSFKNPQPTNMVFHPWHLKEYNNRWFVFGISEGFDNLTNLALDRITNIEELNIDFRENKRLNFQEYFDDFVGVTKEDQKLEKVLIRVDATQANYIKTKPIHSSQKKISEDPDSYTFQIEVIPNYELERLILSFGESLKVLKPEYLRDKIHFRLAKNLSNY